MASELINIPENKLDEVLIARLDSSKRAIFIVSFIFESGLSLIIDALRRFLSNSENQLTIITSNYLKCTQPEALESLLTLQSLGAEVYVFDSLNSNQSFHIKSYYFSDYYKSESCIVGSSNLSRSAFRSSLEFNAEISDADFLEDFHTQYRSIWNNPFTCELTESFISEYRLVYEENKNPFLTDERSTETAPEEIETTEIIDIKPFKYIEPNKVQKEALEILETDRELGIEKGLVVMATGLGKTILSALDVQKVRPNRMLFVAHRQEILQQARGAFSQFMKEKDYGYYGGGTKEQDCEFMFAMIQTLGKKKELEKFDKHHFNYIIVDEFHHVGAASYRKLVNYFEPDFFLGLTATPNRTDNIDVLQFCGNNLIYKKNLIDGINLELLCDFEYQGIHDKHVDYTKITWRGKKFDEKELAKSLSTQRRAEYVFKNWLEHKQTRTLAFCSSIKHCDFMDNFFQAKGIKSISVHSQSVVNRDDGIAMLKEGEIDILFSVDLFNEGVDIPVVDTIMMLRPTESKILFLQQLGRGLRIASGKDIVKVIDFIGNHKSFLEKPAALFDFDLNAKNIKDFSEKYNNDKLNLPSKTRIFYDPEVIAFFEELVSKSMSYVDQYKEYGEKNDSRPTASQFHQFIAKLSLVRSDYGSWFEFIKEMGDLTAEEISCLASTRAFLLNLEKTRMTRCFKMILLSVFLENNMENISIDDLCRKSYQSLKNNLNLSSEIPNKFRDHTAIEANFSAWKKYWLDNPVNALIGGNLQRNEPVFFKFEDDYFSCNFEISIKDKKSLIEMAQEIVDFRLFSYKASYDLSYIEMADFEKSHKNQIGKSVKKVETPRFFGLEGKAAREGHYKMTGHANPPGFDGQVIYITLVKSDMEKDHRYHDFFTSKDHLSWQSKKQIHQKHKQCLNLINAAERNKPIHLFVRKHQSMHGTTLPFTYCGEMELIDVSGNNPINVNFKLKTPLSERLEQEFLRI